MAFGVMPFVLALTTAMAITAYLDARGQTSTRTSAAAPPGPQSAPTFTRLMNLVISSRAGPAGLHAD